MRILFLNQFFWPDTAATGQLLSDLTEHLADSGETVEVICGSANYGGSNGAQRPNVAVTRLATPPFSKGIAGRLISYLSFLFGSLWHGLRGPAPDVVVTLTTPPLLSLVGMAIQRLRGARHVIWEMDVYPDVAVDLGVIKRKSLPDRVFSWLADLPRHRADRVIALGECMRSRLVAHGLDANKISIAENWADCDAPAGGFQSVQSLNTEGLSIIYSGNFGRAHDVATIANAMTSLSRAQGFQFVFGGGGSRQAWIRDFCETNDIRTAQFLPYCGREELSARLSACDIGLVTQHKDSAGSVVPSKSYGIMAAGRPVLYIGPRNSTIAQMIERDQCGWQIDCGDVNGLVELLRRLSENKELVYAAGERAYQTFIKRYQRSLGVARLAAGLFEDVGYESESPAQVVNRAKRASAGGSSSRSRVPQNG